MDLLKDSVPWSEPSDRTPVVGDSRWAADQLEAGHILRIAGCDCSRDTCVGILVQAARVGVLVNHKRPTQTYWVGVFDKAGYFKKLRTPDNNHMYELWEPHPINRQP
jgi:hypothetical protein